MRIKYSARFAGKWPVGNRLGMVARGHEADELLKVRYCLDLSFAVAVRKPIKSRVPT